MAFDFKTWIQSVSRKIFLLMVLIWPILVNMKYLLPNIVKNPVLRTGCQMCVVFSGYYCNIAASAPKTVLSRARWQTTAALPLPLPLALRCLSPSCSSASGLDFGEYYWKVLPQAVPVRSGVELTAKTTNVLFASGWHKTHHPPTNTHSHPPTSTPSKKIRIKNLEKVGNNKRRRRKRGLKIFASPKFQFCCNFGHRHHSGHTYSSSRPPLRPPATTPNSPDQCYIWP